MSYPTCFIQWLNKVDTSREAVAVEPEMSTRTNVLLRDFDEDASSEVVSNTLKDWMLDEDAQNLFLGTHGVVNNDQVVGFGPNGKNYLGLDELVKSLKIAGKLINFWGGACRSSELIPKLDELLKEEPHRPVFEDVVSFATNVAPLVVLDTLRSVGAKYGVVDGDGNLQIPDLEDLVWELRNSGTAPSLELYRLTGSKYERIVPGPDPIWRDFVHEAGHAVIIEYLGGKVVAIDFTPAKHEMGTSAGRTESEPRKADLNELIYVAMAGVAAEMVVAGATSEDTAYAAACDQESLRQHLAEVDGSTFDLESFGRTCIQGKANMIRTIRECAGLGERVGRLARGLQNRYESGFSRTEGDDLRRLLD